MILYDYFRSSAAYRVRIALNLKNVSAEQRSVHLGRRDNRLPQYKAVNPQGFVPYLIDGSFELSQSLAIIEYLDELYPDPPLLPKQPADRARVRAIAQLIACDIHPVNNTRILHYLETELGVDEAGRKTWYRHWIAEGFEALEKLLAASGVAGPFCWGDTPTLADICLVPQVANARRFKCDLAAFPRIVAAEANCMKLAAFDQAQPARQPDAE